MDSNHSSEDQQHDVKSSNSDRNGNTVLRRIVSFAPAEYFEWGIDSEMQPYEEYKWCENDFYEDSSYVKTISTGELLEALKIQLVGNGLTDMICSPDDVDILIDFCNATGRSIKGFTWWCHVTDAHKPCGMGGPNSKYYDGWFSEIPMDDIISLADNDSYKDYFKTRWPADPHYKDCYWPGFWAEE